MLTMKNNQNNNKKCWVIKIGSSQVTDANQGLNREAIARWSEQFAQLKKRGINLVLVSSGAVAEGMSRLGWKRRPHALQELQAAAAVGQMGLIQAYESSLQRFNIHTAQILLTHEDIKNRQHYLNAKHTLKTLIKLGVIPVINENDTITTDEIRFGDNDNLAAMVANLVEADRLVILTDQAGLFSNDPRKDKDAVLIAQAKASDPTLDKIAGGAATNIGSGGMKTKIEAARRAARSGTVTSIVDGSEKLVLMRLAIGESIGTVLTADSEPMAARKQWLAGQLQIRGKLVLDTGAVAVLTQQGKSLLPVGVTEVQGNFKRGDLVACVDKNGHEVARGLVNYDAVEANKIKGFASSEIEDKLGYVDGPELIHRDDLVVT